MLENSGSSPLNAVTMQSGPDRLNSVHTMCIHCKDKWIYKGWFVKIGDSIQFKGFLLVEFLENRRSGENQKPPKVARKVDFSLWPKFFLF